MSASVHYNAGEKNRYNPLTHGHNRAKRLGTEDSRARTAGLSIPTVRGGEKRSNEAGLLRPRMSGGGVGLAALCCSRRLKVWGLPQIVPRGA